MSSLYNVTEVLEPVSSDGSGELVVTALLSLIRAQLSDGKPDPVLALIIEIFGGRQAK